MAYASRLGRARVSPSNPSAAAICDRCGFVYNHSDLSWQFDWRGSALENIRVLVCHRCKDKPQEQLRAIVIPADPIPVMHPRLPDYDNAETDFHTASAPVTLDPRTGIPVPSTTTFVNLGGSYATGLPYGGTGGVDIDAVQPLFGTTIYRVNLAPTSVTSLGNAVVTVTCSTPHNLATGAQIVAQGLANSKACGSYTVTVISATAFTYATSVVIPAGSLLTNSSLIVTANIGLPRGYNNLGA